MVGHFISWRGSNEGRVGGEATASPPCRRLFRTAGSESAARRVSSETSPHRPLIPPEHSPCRGQVPALGRFYVCY